MVTASQYPDLVFPHLVYEAMLLIDASGPQLSSCFNGSGLPKPRMILKRRGVNSKLLNNCLVRESSVAPCRLQKAILHRLALEQVCGFPLRRNLPPEFDGDDDLDLPVRHVLGVPPREKPTDFRP